MFAKMAETLEIIEGKFQWLILASLYMRNVWNLIRNNELFTIFAKVADIWHISEKWLKYQYSQKRS